MKFFIKIVLSACLVTQASFANTAANASSVKLSEAYSNYKKSVASSDGSSTAITQIANNYAQNISQIMSNEGLSSKDVVTSILASENFSPEDQKDIQNYADFAQKNHISQAEQIAYIQKIADKYKKTGSNYDGDGYYFLVAGLVLLLVAVAILGAPAGHTYTCNAYNYYTLYAFPGTGSTVHSAAQNALNNCYASIYTSYLDSCYVYESDCY